MNQNKKVIVCFTQTKLEDIIVLPQPLLNVIGMKVEFINLSGVVNTDNFIALSCMEAIDSDFVWNRSNLFGIQDPLVWIQPFPITSISDQTESEIMMFKKKQLQTVHLSLRPYAPTLSFNALGYIRWKITFYYE